MTRFTAAEIQQLLKSYRERGPLTRSAFCEKREISPSALDYYLRRYGKPANEPVALARVALTPAETPGRFTLHLTNGRRIECDSAGLAQLIRAAEAI